MRQAADRWGGGPIARSRGGGFTYVELLMTACVIAVLAAISIPQLIPRYQTYRLRAAAWQVAGDLRLTRQRAVTTRNLYRFVFVASGDATVDATTPNTYIIQYSAPAGGAWVQEVPAAAGARRALAGGIRIAEGSTPSTRAITFNPNGSVVPTGSLRLLGTGGQGVSVTVDQVGRVQVN